MSTARKIKTVVIRSTPGALFDAALDAVNKKYKVGMLETTAAERPTMAAELDRAELRLDAEWRGSGPVASAAFKSALRDWFNSIMLIIEYHQGRQDEQ